MIAAQRRFWLVPVLVTAIAPPALAQAIAPPTAPTSGLFASRRTADPNSPTPEVTFTLDFGGGYDQNVEGTAVPIQVFSPQQSGYLGTGAGTLRFRKGTTDRFFESAGRGYVSHASAGASRLIGGDVNIQTATTVGRRNGISAGGGFTYEPTVLFNAFGPVAGLIEDGVVPGAGPLQGITDQRWLSAQAVVGAYRNLSPRQRLDGQYSYSQREPTSGPGFESRAQLASARHTWNARPSAGLQTSYRYNDTRQTDEFGLAFPLRSHAMEGAVNLMRAMSPDRRMTVTFGGGAARTERASAAGSASFWLPTVFGSARLDVARDWSVSGDLRRDVSMLEGLSPDTFATNAFSVRADGVTAQRFQIALSASYSKGASQSIDAGSYQTAVATAQLQYAISRCCAVFTSYSYYHHELENLLVVQPGIPDRYSLNSIRFGFNFWAPLYGRF